MRLLETNEHEAIDSPTPLNETKTPHCERPNLVMELTTVGARGQVFTYGIPVAITLSVFVDQLQLEYRRHILDLELPRL